MFTRFAPHAALALAIAAVSGPALAARTFCCTDDNGVRACGDVLPETCRNKAYVEFNEKGQKVRSQEAPLSEAQQAVRDAEQKRKREEERQALEQRRRDLALLNTYATEKDLDTARDRQIAEIERSMKQTQEKIEAANKTKAKLAKEAEFYSHKPLPPDLKESIRRNEADIVAQNGALEAKGKEIEETKTRFETDRQRLKVLRSKDEKK
ncbi:hypothetical protein DLREEDagrD3_11160 [Denitratisoma sp. agr-D3]